MSALVTLALDPATAALIGHVSAVHAAVHADGISDTANKMVLNWTTVLKGAAVLVAIVIVVWTAVKTKLAVASMIVAALMAGALLWAVTGNGLGWFSTSIDQEVTNGLSSSLPPFVDQV